MLIQIFVVFEFSTAALDWAFPSDFWHIVNQGIEQLA
jgi:hypothetical protein